MQAEQQYMNYWTHLLLHSLWQDLLEDRIIALKSELETFMAMDNSSQVSYSSRHPIYQVSQTSFLLDLIQLVSLFPGFRPSLTFLRLTRTISRF